MCLETLEKDDDKIVVARNCSAISEMCVAHGRACLQPEEVIMPLRATQTPLARITARPDPAVRTFLAKALK